ncbi:MAG: hypothetical protein ACRYHQ_26795 [Janthinobacterium lividum]
MREQLNQEPFPVFGPPAPAEPDAGARQARALSADTARIYAGAWAAFQAWCRAQGAVALPAAADTVAAYLGACAPRLGPGGLRGVLAALAQRHRLAGQSWPAGDPIVLRALAGLTACAVPPRPATAFTTAGLRQLLGACGEQGDGDDGLAASRDRALLLAGFAAGLRRSELVALDHPDVRFTAHGMVLHVPARARAGGPGEVAVARGADPSLCAVRALKAWLRHAGIAYGPVFLHVTATGTLEGRLTGNGVWKIVRRRAGLAGLVVPAGERLSPQALRKGFGARGA